MRREEKLKRGWRWWMCVMLHLERIAMVGMSEEDTDVCWPLVHHLPQCFLQSFFFILFGEDLWRWPSVNCIKMNQAFWVFLCSSDYLLPVCLPHHSMQQFVKMKWCNKSRRLKNLHERKTLKSWPISGVGKFFEASSFTTAPTSIFIYKRTKLF